MITTIKPILRGIRASLPSFIQTAIYRLRFAVKFPKLVPALNDYTYTDEHLKFVHILEAINYLRIAGVGGDVLPQTYLEFGCHSGRTFSAAVRAAKYFDMSNAEFYAFDSFEGLPDTTVAEDGFFERGTFCTGRSDFVEIVRKKTGMKIADSHIIEGYYCNSLTPQVQARMPKAGVVHIDVDLYSSTVDVLEFIKPLLVVGTLLIFDDWYCFPPGANMGEQRAVKEFCDANPSFKLREWKAYSTFGQSYFVTALAS
jgi:hypothetical protein